MLDFGKLVLETEFVEDDDIHEYLTDFFVEDNFNQYHIDIAATIEEVSLIKEMFVSQKEILERAKEVLEKDKYCVEAFFVCFHLADESELFAMFNSVYNEVHEYKNLDIYRKDALLSILNMYVRFLSYIKNMTLSIKVLKTIIRLEGYYSDNNIVRLSYMYCVLENKNDFYDLYLTIDFKQSIPYILLIVTLLKHEEEIKAKEVFHDFLQNNKYAYYIDHIWDIEENQEIEAVEFKNAVELCFEEICSIPYFFSWCFDNKELDYRS